MARLESILKNTDRVAIDTNSLIYLLEKNEKYFEICKEVFYSIEKGIKVEKQENYTSKNKRT